MQNKETVVPLVKKCGITTNVDGTENNEVIMQGLYGYIMLSLEAEYRLENDETDEHNDDGMGEDEDDKTNGEYKIDESGDTKH